MSNATDTRVTTGRVRFSYANLFHPRSINGGPEKYSVTLLIPKGDKKTLGKIQRAIEAATEQAKEKSKSSRQNPTPPSMTVTAPPRTVNPTVKNARTTM